MNIIIGEYLIFVLMTAGSFFLSHLGLLLVGRIDTYLSPENRQRPASSSPGGGGIRSLAQDNLFQPRSEGEVTRNVALRTE